MRTAPGPYPPDCGRSMFERRNNAGSSRTPSHPARRTRTIWQCWPVPALSGLLPPTPAPSGAGCPQLHRPATTGSAVVVSHLHSNISASWRTDASIKLSAVASSLTTVSARAMLAAMIAGERDARVLAELAKGKMRAKIPELTEALTGHFDAHHAQLAASILHRLDLVEEALAELDALIADACAPWARQIELLQTIPGVGVKVAQVIVAETGGDMSRFPSAAHLAAWAGVAPAIHESAGKRLPAGARHGNKWLTTMLVEAAGLGGPDEGQELSGRSARPAHRTARDGPGPGRGRPLHPGLGLLHAQPRRALPGPRRGLAGPPQQRGPHPPAGRPTRTARPHRDPRSRRLSRRKNTPGSRPGR